MTDNTNRLLQIMARLRDPEGGCPWDLQQTFASIAPYTIEEAYEVADAIERGDMAALKDELGDLLLQVAFHARMAEEAGYFDFDAVAGAIAEKMVRRHPHVFANARHADEASQRAAWEDAKAAERAVRAADAGDRPPGALDGVPLALPALIRAEKLANRAGRVGFDWPDVVPVFDKLQEEIAELRAELEAGGVASRIEDELGDVLFAAVNLARHLGVDPEKALRSTNGKFERRFRAMEAAYREAGRDLAAADLADKERQWQAVKRDA